MPSRKSTSTALADKLDQLGFTVDECAAVCGVPVEVVTDWIEGGPDAEGAIRLRWLDNDEDARRRLEQARRTVTTNLESDGAQYAGVESPPYGTGDIGKVTGGVSS